MLMNEPVNITVSQILKRKTERHLYDALAILEGGGQPRLEHNAHALKSAAKLLRNGQVQTSDAALWAIEGSLAKYDWPPPRLKLWKKALEAYMECSAESSYRCGVYENRQTRIRDGVRKVRGKPMEAINKRVKRILKQDTEADRLEEKLAPEEYLELMDINEDVTGVASRGWGLVDEKIAENIDYTLKREGYQPESVRATIEEVLLIEEDEEPGQRATDVVLATWTAYFPDGSSAGGRAVVDGVWQSAVETYTIVSLRFGGNDLMYFG